MGYRGGRLQPEERGRRCRLQMWERRHRKPEGEERPAEMSGAGCSPKKGGCRSSEVLLPSERRAGWWRWALGMRLLGTWPATSDVGRTPESTSAEERVATQRLLCSSGPHPFLPLLSQFIYPSSKDSLTVPRGWLKWPRGGL